MSGCDLRVPAAVLWPGGDLLWEHSWQTLKMAEPKVGERLESLMTSLRCWINLPGAPLSLDFSLEAEYISLLLQASESRFSITFSLNHPNTYTVQWRLVQSETRWRTEPECGFQLQHWCPGTSFCKTLMPLPYKAFPSGGGCSLFWVPLCMSPWPLLPPSLPEACSLPENGAGCGSCLYPHGGTMHRVGAWKVIGHSVEGRVNPC